MKKLFVMAMASIATLLLPVTTSTAAEASAYAALTSNYVFRGQTQTKDGAAIQASYDMKESPADTGWYAGTFASTVSSGIELDLYGGWKGAFSKKNNMGYDVGAILYKYTDSNFSSDITELYAGINYETAYVKIFFGNGPGISNYTYLDVGAEFIVLQDMDLALHYGRSSLTNSNDLSANISAEIKGFDLGLGLTYADAGATTNIEFFVTVKKDFDL